MMYAKIGAVQADFFCGNRQLNRLKQGIARRPGFVGGMFAPMPKG
jgi:hypothetical protein